jgi:hypothetical protein
MNEQDISNNKLRAISAGILLVLALASMFLNTTRSTIDIILIALASFLVGGAILANVGKPTI